jgi:CheY-like chemotaxis protein
VLVVDDHVDSLDLLVQFLSFRGHAVFAAATGTEALVMAERVHPDVILLDIALPDIDGWEVARRIRADDRHPRVVIIAVTAHAFKSAIQAALKAGCDCVLTKPVDLSVLAAAIEADPGTLEHC